MEVCKECMIPDSFPNVTFSNGLCSFCTDYKQSARTMAAKGNDKLQQVIGGRKSSEYDCIVPVSGGKDSSYILFYVVRKMGLKPLAIFFDSGFATDFSKRNVEKMRRKLLVDQLVFKSSRFRRAAVREAFHISRYLNKFTGICVNCENNVRAVAINEATKRRIPFILWGSTDFEDVTTTYYAKWAIGRFRKEFGEKKVSESSNIFRVLKSVRRYQRSRILGHTVKYHYNLVRDNVVTRIPEGWRKIDPFVQVSFENKRVQTIYFYDYVEYNPFKYMEILQRELAWEAPLLKEAAMDCKLHCFANYDFLRSTGMTRDGFYLSTLVRRGLLKKTDAVKREEAMKNSVKSECQETLKELGFSDYNLA